MRLILVCLCCFFISEALSAAPPPLPFDQLPELKQIWEVPLDSYGFVAFTPKGDKAVFLDKKSITVFNPKTGKKTRQVPHNFSEPYGISCSDTDVSAWRSVAIFRYASSTAKIAGANRSVGLKAADPRYSPNGDFLVCAAESGPQLFSTDTGDWGKPRAELELDEPVAAGFLDSGKKLFAVNKIGEYLIADVPSGRQLSSGTLPSWPKAYEQFALRYDGLRPIAFRTADSEVLIANGQSILAYDLSVIPKLDRTLRTSLSPRFLELAGRAPVGFTTSGLSHIQSVNPTGDAEAITFDTRTGAGLGRLPVCSACVSASLSPDGQLLIAVVADPRIKKKPARWSLRCWQTDFAIPD